MHLVLAPLLKTLCNTTDRVTWVDLDRKLRVTAELTVDLGLIRERQILQSVMFAGKRLLDQGSDPPRVLYLLTEKLPNTRGVDLEQLAMDKLAIRALV